MNNGRGQWVGGLLLIGLGLLFLLNQFMDLPRLENVAIYFVLFLGIIFLAWGIFSREAGLMVPGGILTGIGLGVALVAGPFAVASGDRSGGIFMAAFALGWVLITVFTAIFTEKTMWWPLIPAAIMALVSGALLVQGPFWVALEWLGKLWPLALILGGIAILFGARRSRGEKDAEQFEVDETAVDKLKTE